MSCHRSLRPHRDNPSVSHFNTCLPPHTHTHTHTLLPSTSLSLSRICTYTRVDTLRYTHTKQNKTKKTHTHTHAHTHAQPCNHVQTLPPYTPTFFSALSYQHLITEGSADGTDGVSLHKHRPRTRKDSRTASADFRPVHTHRWDVGACPMLLTQV